MKKIQKWRLVRDILIAVNGGKLSNYAKRKIEFHGLDSFGYIKAGQFNWEFFTSDYWFTNLLAHYNYRYEQKFPSSTPEIRQEFAENFIFWCNVWDEIKSKLNIRKYSVKYTYFDKREFKARHKRKQCFYYGRNLSEAVKLFVFRNKCAKIHSFRDVGLIHDSAYLRAHIKFPELINLWDKK